MKVAVIGGSGKMGRWLADFLMKDGQEVLITGRNEQRLLEIKQQLGVEVATITAAVKSADAVLLSVPIGSFEEVVEQVSPYTRPGMVMMPQGFGLNFGDEKVGVNVNALTEARHRDRLAATPHHRRVPCRLEPLAK